MPHLYVALDKTISLVNEHKWGTYLSSLLTFILYLLFIPILSLFLSSQRTGLMVESLPLSLSLLQGPLHLNTSKHYSSPHLFIHMLSPHRVFLFLWMSILQEWEGTEETLQSAMTWEAQLPDPLRLFLKWGLTPEAPLHQWRGTGGTLLQYYLCSDVKHSHQ